MAKRPASVVIDIEGCKGCVLCVDVCPPRVLVMADDVNAKGYRFPRLLEGCTGCELCAKVCPDFVIEVYRGLEAAAGS